VGGAGQDEHPTDRHGFGHEVNEMTAADNEVTPTDHERLRSPVTAPDAPPSSPPRARGGIDLEVVAVIILAVVTILTAWSAFEATKWSGVMAIAFSEANAARTEATQAAARVNAKQAVDVGLFVAYVEARSTEDEELAAFLEERFRHEFRPAFDAWVALDPLTNPDAPASPLAMDEYVIAEQIEAEELAATADLRGQQARDANQTGDDYVLVTVLFASVLFFAGVSTKVRGRRSQQLLIGMALVLLATGGTILLTFPVEI
jgi:hypothetical protein